MQRTTFAGGDGAREVNIEGSVVQRTEFKGDDGQKKRDEERLRREQERHIKQKEEDERARKEREVLEQQHRKDEERKTKEAQERLQKQKAEEERARSERLLKQESARGEREHKEGGHVARQRLVFLAFVVIGVLAVGYWMMNPGSDYIDATVESSSSDITGMEATIEPSSSDTVGVGATVAQTPQVSSTDTPAAVTASSGETPKTVTNSIGMEFVLIPAGEFKMGSPSGEGGRRDNECPVHTVPIEKAYYLGKYEVTQEQWLEVMGPNLSYFEGNDLPVVSWNDAQEFIKKLNEREGTNKYRLPSEAEWEYAARAGTTTSYSFGDSSSDLGDYAWYYINSGDNIHPVGQKKPNPWGLYDMHGNVWEWVQDRYHSSYDGAPTDGSAWEDGSSSLRVLRGGCWSSSARDCLLAYRGNSEPENRFEGFGFRLLQ